MVHQILEGLYRITVALPESPLRSLNCYIIKTETRNLLIDTGFNRPECLHSLQEGIQELELDMNVTDIFATHFHADHCGLISKIASPSSRVFMTKTDCKLLDLVIEDPDSYWRPIESIFEKEGFPTEELERTRKANPARNYVSEQKLNCIFIDDGMILPFGSGNLKCIFTPGHTPGHVCLYDSQQKTLFSGDHILFDITPNITTWEIMPDSLTYYLKSLKKVFDLPVERTLTGHRENNGDFKERVSELIIHHQERLASIVEIIRKNPGLNGYEIAGKMKWSIRAKNWGDFPPAQRWFAVGEAISHLNYLVDHKRIQRRQVNGINTYYLV